LAFAFNRMLRGCARSRVGGARKYRFRAVDKTDRLIDFMLSERRNTSAVYDAGLGADIDHHRQARLLFKSDPTVAA